MRVNESALTALLAALHAVATPGCGQERGPAIASGRAATHSEPAHPTPSDDGSASQISADLLALTSSTDRASPSAGQAQAADYIVSRLRGRAWLPAGDDGYRHAFSFTPEGEQPTTLHNIAALWPGAANEGRSPQKVVVVSGHYDTVAGTPGADDNASGSAVLLTLVDAIPRSNPDHPIALVWFSAEEHGLIGSDAWTAEPTLPPGYEVALDINIDSVGRGPPTRMLWAASEGAAGDRLGLGFQHAGLGCGLSDLDTADEYWRQSDHASFVANLDVPALFLFAGPHEDLHSPRDSIEKLTPGKISRVSCSVLALLEGIEADGLLGGDEKQPTTQTPASW